MKATTSPPTVDDVAAAVKAAWGIDGTVERLDGENDNYGITAADGTHYVLKVASADHDADRIRLEQAAVEAIEASSIEIAVPGAIPDREGELVVQLSLGGATVARSLGDETVAPSLGGETARPARLLRFVEGEPWTKRGCNTTPPSPAPTSWRRCATWSSASPASATCVGSASSVVTPADVDRFVLDLEVILRNRSTASNPGRDSL